MASSLVFVSRPALSRTDFIAVLQQAAAQGLISKADENSIKTSGQRLVAKFQIEQANHPQLQQAAAEFVDALVAGGSLDYADLCLAAVPAELTNAPQLLLLMDVDSTLIKQEVIELLAAHAGREKEVAAVTEAAMRGELDFAQSLIQRVATLKDLPDTVLVEVGKRIIFSEGAQSLVRRFHAAGHKVGVVSGGFQQILDPLAAQLDLDHALANTLGITDAVLDGTVHGQIVDREMKETMLRGWAEEHQIPLEATIAAGDGANDLAMVAASGLGIAFNAKPALRNEADVRLDFAWLDVIADLVLDDLA
ncbi:phosphoserine phosphatase SerB [Glutamicibacter arilaitensis]|uniref:phosphoserine phosphatase n=1 Tax=Glutamicibacter arilaitensis TaxID=256701 RepID=A0A2N7S4D2_9MICC|nr:MULTISPECIES: phosphoserine phosphatase SerB [Glutamicibacter]PMQ20992.1 phosphoserine phosphatase SerB [Glutamicibacter arilaitensis]HCJ55319.1 phosphoserine phosphatase SerB [Glutamicibacter sp.]